MTCMCCGEYIPTKFEREMIGFMGDSPMTNREITDGMSRHRQQINRALVSLVKNKILIRTEENPYYYYVSEEFLDKSDDLKKC